MLINIHTHYNQNNKQEIVQSDKIETENYFSFGIVNKTYPDDPAFPLFLDQVYAHKNCLAIGEIGIDKNSTIDLNKQIQIFKKQIFDSEIYQLPVILHCVKGWNEILQIKKEIKPNQPWVFHGFRKTNLLNSVIDSGTFISIGTAIIWDKKLQEHVKTIPLNRLFLETDNDINYKIQDVYEKIASIKNISLQTLEDQLYFNTINTFKKWEIG